MRILYLVELFPKDGESKITGGVESRYFYLQKYLQKLGCEVNIISRSDKWEYSSWSSIISRFLYLIVGTIKAFFSNFDIIEGTNYTNYPIAWLVGVIKRKPIVFCYHDVFIGTWVINTGVIGIIGEICERIILRFPVDKYIAVSETTRMKMIKNGVDPNKITVIHNGIEPTKIRNTKRAGLICVSRLIGYKHVEQVVRAANKLKVNLTVIGQGPEFQKLKKMARTANFLGLVPDHKEVLKKIAQAMVFCSASKVEGFGISAIEAASLGTPMVLSDISAFKEITDNGKGALLFKEQTELDQCIKKILNDKKLWLKKSKEAKIIAKKYYWSDLSRKVLKVYENINAN